MKKYEPEMGQAVFGQPWQEYPTPEWAIALLEGIRARIKVAGWNEYQREFDPFDDWEDAEIFNKKHKEMGFEVWPYSWDDEKEQKYNFKVRDIEFRWYKHIGRGDTVNRKITTKEMAEIFDKCANNLSEWQHRNMTGCNKITLVKV